MKIQINGQNYDFKQKISVAELIAHLELDPRKIAIEHNLCIVPNNEYDTTYIKDLDNIEIVEFIGGG